MRFNPGGMMGPWGSRGWTPTNPLYGGNNGKDGTFVMKIKHACTNLESSFTARYNLEFESIVTEQVSSMVAPKTYEFGETVFVTKIKVKNTGRMPTPSQRVLFKFGEVEGVNYDLSSHIFLRKDTCVPQDRTAYADEGFMKFDCPYPTMAIDDTTKSFIPVIGATDYDPIKAHARVLYNALQLGKENKTTDLDYISDFQAPYADFQSKPDVLHLSYPVENPDSIRGFRALDAMETSILEMTVNNISNQEFGSHSRTGRHLYAQVYYADDRSYDIPIEKITVRAENGTLVKVQPTLLPGASGGKGYRYTISSLPARDSFTVQLSFKFDSDEIQVSQKAGLQIDLYLQKIPTLLTSGETEMHAEKQLIQRRLFVASCQPRFRPEKISDVIMVTTTGSDARQVSAWQAVLNELGFSCQPYSLSRYGHMNAKSKVENVDVAQAFSGKLVLLLNDEYTPMPNMQASNRKRKRPSELLKSVYEHNDSSKFLIVGGTPASVRHLSPMAAATNSKGISIKSFRNRTACLDEFQSNVMKRRVKGFGMGRMKPLAMNITVKTKRFGKPSSVSINNILKAKAKRTSANFRRVDPLRPYAVVWIPYDEAKLVEDALFSTWEIGTLQIKVGPPRYQNPISFVIDEKIASDATDMSQPSKIKSRTMLYSVLHAISFKARLDCYSRQLMLSSNPSGKGRRRDEILSAIKDCLVRDFVMDISNYYHGAFVVRDALNRSPTIHQLRYSQSINELLSLAGNNKNLLSTLKENLTTLMGALWCAAKSKDLRPWWKPFSSKFQVSQHMMESLYELQKHWTSVLDTQKIVEERLRLKEVLKSDIRKRKNSDMAMLGLNGRWRAALVERHSPRNNKNNQTTNSSSGGEWSTRIRRESELHQMIENGKESTTTTWKIKKCCKPRIMDHSSSVAEVTESFATHQFLQEVEETTTKAYELYARPTDI